MPTHSAANAQTKQLYVDGHLCYAYKIGIVTNGFGIVRHLNFYNKDFLESHPLINPKNFLGDAAFDSVGLYKALLSGDTFGKDKHFSSAYIPLNPRAHLENIDYKINEDGIPGCPKDETLPMKYECISKFRSGVSRYRFMCPKMIWDYNSETKRSHRKCTCDSPCTDSKCGRMIYIIHLP